MLRAFARIWAVFFTLVVPGTAKPFDYLKKLQGRGPSGKAIHGNAWAEQAGQPVHHQASENDIEKQVREEEEARAKATAKNHVPLATPKVHAPLGITDARAMAHLRKIIHGNGAPAPGPAPGPGGPAPWTEDPEWMVDGARGDKTRTVPITDQFKGLESIPQPEQGFHGRPVQHADMDSMTGDWSIEFGPKGPMSAYEVCLEHPRSWWCKQHMHQLGGPVVEPGQKKPPWSGACHLLGALSPTVAALFIGVLH